MHALTSENLSVKYLLKRLISLLFYFFSTSTQGTGCKWKCSRTIRLGIWMTRQTVEERSAGKHRTRRWVISKHFHPVGPRLGFPWWFCWVLLSWYPEPNDYAASDTSQHYCIVLLGRKSGGGGGENLLATAYFLVQNRPSSCWYHVCVSSTNCGCSIVKTS